MESLLNLPLAGEARVRILQITDTHLFAEKHETLLGINTWESYQAVLDAIHASQRECDLIVATGDLAQDHSAAAYQHFAEGIASFAAPCVWLPGNHDFQPAMYSTLQESGISPAKRVFLGDHWQILLLIEWPALIRLALPGLGNLWLNLVKDTALVSVIALNDLMRVSTVAVGATRKPFLFFLLVCLLYWLICGVSGRVLVWLERKTQRGYPTARQENA